jgi:hypothetical protein
MRRHIVTLLAVSVFLADTLAAKPQPKFPAQTIAEEPLKSEKNESKIKDSKFRFQIGLMTGVQTNPIQSNQYVQDDVTTMNTTVNAINSTSSSPQAQIQTQSAVVYAVPVGLSIQTVFFDFLRVRLHGTYDFPITMTNQYSDKSGGLEKVYTSELRVTQIQAPLLFMFDIPISKENTLYIGGGPTIYWGRIEKSVSEAGAASSTTAAYTKSDLDRIEGLAYGPTFIIGMQRRIGTLFSVHVDLLYQSGARGGFVDKLQNIGLSSSTDKPGGFSDLSNNPGDEKKTDGSYNQGSPKIMNFEGIRLLFGLNMHVDF